MTNAGIEAFLIVCKQHSISKAAAELFISQSSLSIRLRTLEKEVGCPCSSGTRAAARWS